MSGQEVIKRIKACLQRKEIKNLIPSIIPDSLLDQGGDGHGIFESADGTEQLVIIGQRNLLHDGDKRVSVQLIATVDGITMPVMKVTVEESEVTGREASIEFTTVNSEDCSGCPDVRVGYSTNSGGLAIQTMKSGSLLSAGWNFGEKMGSYGLPTDTALPKKVDVEQMAATLLSWAASQLPLADNCPPGKFTPLLAKNLPGFYNP
jgi:hypothetical protein